MHFDLFKINHSKIINFFKIISQAIAAKLLINIFFTCSMIKAFNFQLQQFYREDKIARISATRWCIFYGIDGRMEEFWSLEISSLVRYKLYTFLPPHPSFENVLMMCRIQHRDQSHCRLKTLDNCSHLFFPCRKVQEREHLKRKYTKIMKFTGCHFEAMGSDLEV